jgi:histidinol phosphatase-like PHP family hydrolase
LRLPLDTHNHLRDWSDGRQTIEELLECAKNLGVRVGVSDHAGTADRLGSSEALERYAEFLSAYPVVRGCEMDLDRSFLVEPQVRARFDYIIGSVHGVMLDGKRISFSRTFNALQGKDPGYDPRKEIPDTRAFLKAHLDLLASEFSRQQYDILGHCSMLPPLVLGSPEEVFPPWWEDALVDLLKSHGVAVEISNRWKTPYERLLVKCVEQELHFSMGSDGHDTKRSCRLDYPLAMVARYRIPQERVFDVPR